MTQPTPFASPPQLDHVFVTVDAQTLKGINECRFLQDEQLGRFLIRESESTLLGRYQPTRVFGDNTLVEIFPDAFGGDDFRGIAAGVIFSFDQPGQTAAARQRLQDSGIAFGGALVERIGRSTSGESHTLPWYQFTRPDMGPDSCAALFFHELTPEYFARIGAERDDQGRQNRAAHFNAALRRPPAPDQLMKDIVGVTVGLGREHIARAASILAALGYTREDDGNAVRLQGDTGVITFIPEERSPGRVELTIRLSRAMPLQRFEFSPWSSLVMSPQGADDHSAVWTFIPPPKGAGQ